MALGTPASRRLDHYFRHKQAGWKTALPGGRAPLTEANHLGNVAYRVGKKITWDAKKLKVTNAPEAASLIRREYRKGWSL